MSSTRGRTLKMGGMAADAGGSARTEPGAGNAPITRPAYRSPGGGTQFSVAGSAPVPRGGLGSHPLLDFSGVTGWRLLFTVAAAFYLGFWFLSLTRGGVSGGVRL